MCACEDEGGSERKGRYGLKGIGSECGVAVGVGWG